MKKLIYFGATALAVSAFLFSCEKEDIKNHEDGSNTESPVMNNKANGSSEGYELAQEKRSYTWVDKKLDCSQDGSGCTVNSRYISEAEEIDLSVIQVNKLIEIGRYTDLSQYFLTNDLSYEFPTFYESDFYDKLESGNLILDFKFPYLTVSDNHGTMVEVYNYESTLSNSTVVETLRAAGGYDKKASLSTEPGSVWDCSSDGDNCKVSRVSFAAAWLADNPQYAFAPHTDNVSTVEVSEDENGEKIMITTESGAKYGIEF